MRNLADEIRKTLYPKEKATFLNIIQYSGYSRLVYTIDIFFFDAHYRAVSRDVRYQLRNDYAKFKI